MKKEKPFFKFLRIVVGLILFVRGVVGIGTTLYDIRTEKEVRQQEEQNAISELKNSYDKLEVGMTYEECVSIIGSAGKLFSETESEYFGKSSVYLWKPEDSLFTGIEAHFDDGKLSAKSWMEV